TPPHWAYIALGVLVGLTLIVLALPAGRRLLLSRVGSLASQVVPRLLDVAQRPAKLAEGVGGSVLVSVAYILCLAASGRAVGAARTSRWRALPWCPSQGTPPARLSRPPAASAPWRPPCPLRWQGPGWNPPRRSRQCSCSGR